MTARLFLQHHKHVLPIPLFNSITFNQKLVAYCVKYFHQGCDIFLLCPYNLASSCYHNNLRYFKMPEKHMFALRKKQIQSKMSRLKLVFKPLFITHTHKENFILTGIVPTAR